MKKYEEDSLTEELNKLNKTLKLLVRQRTLPYAFISAIVTAVGSLIGATIIFALIGYVVSKLDYIPFVRFIQQNIPQK